MEVGGGGGGACGEPSYARVGTPRARSAAVKQPLPAGGRNHDVVDVVDMSWVCHVTCACTCGRVVDMSWACRGRAVPRPEFASRDVLTTQQGPAAAASAWRVVVVVAR